MEKISLKIYLKLYKEHVKLLTDYINLKSKYNKLLNLFDEDWLGVVK